MCSKVKGVTTVITDLMLTLYVSAIYQPLRP